jgi:hypothetical protein
LQLLLIYVQKIILSFHKQAPDGFVEPEMEELATQTNTVWVRTRASSIFTNLTSLDALEDPEALRLFDAMVGIPKRRYEWHEDFKPLVYGRKVMAFVEANERRLLVQRVVQGPYRS